ncbi:MAG: hypothetical protein M3Y21_00035 [Candidatus Eremiobacteraeota bacterium]|nr:hypothetical protein [Candidatus Eremiobacteraeota bacterium]
MPVEFPLRYTLDGDFAARDGLANDLSAGGLRLCVDEDFIKGSRVELEFKLPDEFLANMTVEKGVYEQSPFGLRPETIKVQPHGFDTMRIEAQVLVTFFDVHRRKFAHGLAFSDLPEKTAEELQRFIHLWQINQLRHRHGDL